MNKERKLIVSEKFKPTDIRGYFDIEIYKIGREYEVIMTQPKDQIQKSITNAIEYVATEIRRRYLRGVWPSKIRWIEHYHPTESFERLANRVYPKWKWLKFRYVDAKWGGSVNDLDSIHAQQ